MVDPREWRPRMPGSFQRGDVAIRVLGNIGDLHPFDYGGHIVHIVRQPDGHRTIESEFWEEPFEEEGGEPEYTVYRWLIEKDVIGDLGFVDWKRVAETHGMDVGEIKRYAVSPNPLERAMVYEMVGRYSGFDELDSYPETFTREEMEARWPEFGDRPSMGSIFDVLKEREVSPIFRVLEQREVSPIFRVLEERVERRAPPSRIRPEVRRPPAAALPPRPSRPAIPPIDVARWFDLQDMWIRIRSGRATAEFKRALAAYARTQEYADIPLVRMAGKGEEHKVADFFGIPTEEYDRMRREGAWDRAIGSLLKDVEKALNATMPEEFPGFLEFAFDAEENFGLFYFEGGD